MKQLLVIFGAPGSGKGFFMGKLSEQLQKLGVDNYLYISTGDLLRAEIKNQTPLGKELESIVNSGKLVSDHIVSELVQQALKKDNELKIIDGYPRTKAQVLDIEAARDTYGHEIVSLMIDTPDELIRSRVAKRRVCQDCKATHTADDGCCPKCGGKSLIRKDDAVIATRLEEYYKNTMPVWDDLMDLSEASIVLDGDISAEQVTEFAATLASILVNND